MKKMISAVLCIVLLCSMLSSLAFAKTELNEITISGITAPVPGEKPSYAATVKTDGCFLDSGNNNPNYYKNGLGWYDMSKEFNVSTQTPFEHGHEYRVSVYVSAKDGYDFSKLPKATINGVDAEVEVLENGTLVVSYAFPRLPVANPFTDVHENEYFYESVLWAVENSITAGTTPTTFSPEATCTRAQVVTFLWRSTGSPEPKTSENPFKDVKTTEYYYKAVLWAVENNITAGTGNGMFSPEQGCTRAQVVSFLWRFAGNPEPTSAENPFKDVRSGEYYYKAVLWAVENNITAGTGDGKFSPDDTCTRAQIVAFLHRYSKLTPPLSILFQPEDYHMNSSMEDSEFAIQVKGGKAPYTFQWVVCYDEKEVFAEPVKANSPIHTFAKSISDYDLEEYDDILVYCIVEDASGDRVTSEPAKVFPLFSIVKQPQDYQMESSMETASFTVEVNGSSGPYTYQWVVCYDTTEVWAEKEVSNLRSSTFSQSFSDYDFDDYRDIGVYCVINDSSGQELWSEMAVVYPKN